MQNVPVLGELGQNECCIFFGSGKDGQLLALNKDDGKEKWRFAGKANVSIKPVVGGGSVIIMDAGGNISELDAEDGSPLRQASLAGTFFADFEYADGMVYVGDMGGELFAVDLASARTVWKASGNGAVLVKPLLRDGYLYAAFGRWLSKLDAATGETVWEMDLGSVVRDTPLILDRRILVRTNRFLFALDQAGG
jgi:outer membrane protein assembly factor BamB